MTAPDWAILAIYLAAVLAIALYFRSRANQGVEEFFIADRKLPWWVIGFADVASYTGGGQAFITVFFLSGFAGMWLMAWVSWVIWMPLVAILWARWWRRLEVVTTGEFIELRYGGLRALVYRNVYGLYACVVWGVTSLGYTSAWMAATIGPMLGWPPVQVLVVFGAITILYSLLSGLLAVAYNDVLQFAILIAANTALGVLLVHRAGGMGEVWHRTAALHGANFLQPLPWGGVLTPISLAALCIQGLFFAGSPFAGEGFTAQRYMAARNEFHAVLGQMLNGVLALVVRLIPFILVGLAVAAIYPVSGIAVPASIWGDVVRERAPAGLFGLLLVSAAAGYMATLSSLGNWAASYLMNDVYRRSVRPRASGRELVLMSRVSSGVLLVVALACGALIDPAHLQEWVLFINSSLVVFSLPLAWLKWFWWRLNVIGDMVGVLGGFPAGYVIWFGSDAVLPPSMRAWFHTRAGWNLNGMIPAFSNLDRYPFWMGFAILFALGWTAILTATLLTRQESPEILRAFYLKAKPIGWWGPVRRQLSAEEAAAVHNETGADMAACAAGIVFYFALTVALFGFMGGHLAIAWAAMLGAAVSGALFLKTGLTLSMRNN
ncbi:MAG: sodium:solute symporter family transporter [Bryobacteraceae bacterium]